jgi:hypothetical protein
MKFVFASLLIASLSLPAWAQAPAKPSGGAAAKPAAPSAKPTPAQKARDNRRAAVKALTPGQRQAVEELTPMEEPDPTIKLDERDLAVAKRVHMGEIKCELGAEVEIKPMKREGFFLVRHRLTRFVMHPVHSRTGAIRLEDPARGAVWLQLGNKSMLMNQKEGKRLADECQSPDQVIFANEMKNRPPINILEPEPQPAAAPAAPVAPAASVPGGPAAAAPVAPAPSQ